MAEPRAHPRSHPLSSLATKIILFVFASTLTTALMVSWISLRSTHDSLRDTIARFYPISLEQTAQRTESWLLEAQAEVDALAAVSGRTGSTPELDRIAAASRRLAGWVRVEPDGRVDASAGTTPAAAPECVPAGSAPRTCSIPLAAGRALPGLASPGPGGVTLIGVLDADELATLLAASLPEPESSAILLDARDRVLAHTGDSASAPRTGRPGAHAPRSPHFAEYEQAGRLVLGSRRDLAGSWRVLIETPFEAAFAPVLSVITRLFVGDLLVILLSSLLAYRVTATVVRPIERLSDWARRSAEGRDDLEVPELPARDEIGLLARTLTDMRRQLRRRESELQQANRDLLDRNTRLQQANEVLNQLSITDGLTRLHNHRFFQDHLTREIKRVARSGEPLSMLLIDIDDFKQLNDRFGHAAGDELLFRIGQVLVDSVRESDLAARYGGEEFVILAINCDLRRAEQLAEKLRTAVAESSFILDDSLRPLRVTVSIGVASFRGNRKRFFQRADEALYRAKSQGKNCVVVEEEESERSRSDADESEPEAS